MAQSADDTSFLGTGWSFPPEFSQNGRDVVTTSGEDDIRASLEILFATVRGERFLVPGYGLEPHELFFEPVSTTLRAFLKDRITRAILIDEPRIRILSLQIDSPDANDGTLRIALDYEVRATNSRYNVVFPFYKHDSSEVHRLSAGVRAPVK
jgi:phage baseplate assembly protein W